MDTRTQIYNEVLRYGVITENATHLYLVNDDIEYNTFEETYKKALYLHNIKVKRSASILEDLSKYIDLYCSNEMDYPDNAIDKLYVKSYIIRMTANHYEIIPVDLNLLDDIICTMGMKYKWVDYENNN